MDLKIPRVIFLYVGLCSWATAIPSSEITRGRLCPDQEKFFHNETKRCYFPTRGFAARYEENVVNPCGPLQHFYEASEKYGVCDCVWDDPDDDSLRGCTGENISNRPVLNWPGSKRCYYAYSQGPCQSGEWIVVNRKTFQSECQANPCRNLSILEPRKEIQDLPEKYVRGAANIEIFYFLKNNKCYQTFTQAFCKKNRHVRFRGTNPTPTCFPDEQRIVCPYATTSVAALPCRQGLKLIGNDCVAGADFD